MCLAARDVATRVRSTNAYTSRMARLVKFEGLKPIKIEPQEKAIFICACGLSQTFPLCDGHHKGCAAEEPGCVYQYDADGKNPRKVDPTG